MKLKFKKQQFQTDSVEAIVNCFAGQPSTSGVKYRIDPGKSGRLTLLESLEETGFANESLRIAGTQLLQNICAVQKHENLPESTMLVKDNFTGCDANLDIEMETGTGKTYCY